ncbi:restriction endonuclease subunit S [Gemmata sp. JC673]|uniref:Restriction endonuclease subunit S n=1 Tax=Gemmata algarum TaxID=2975278 RepID=A0ABU5F540_9BACT|nr:restriction endonuclease subunit S [Gemmata algarum]MDY3562698.1 restriction endonuclease subunit S [Gemmata algarum]
MKSTPLIALEEIMASRLGSIDPSQSPDEIFDLYSIPAFDRGEPDVTAGSLIGSTKQFVQPGDVLLSKIVPHIRRAWVVGANRGRRTIASSEWIVFRNQNVEPRFLRYALVADGFHNDFLSTVSGVGGSLLRARPSHVAKIRIPLPPLAEQRRIADILDKADAIRRKRETVTSYIGELLMSAYLEFFREPRQNHLKWPTQNLGAVASVDRGKFTPRPRNDPRFYDGDHPFIQTGDIAASGGILTKWKQTLNKEGAAVSRSFRPGSIVVAIVGATIGETAILAREMYCPDSVVGIVPHGDILTSEYVEYTLRFFKQHFRDMAPETARANINLETLRPLQVPIPPLELQMKFSAVFRKCYAMSAKLSEPTNESDGLFHSLVQRAFRGEL